MSAAFLALKCKVERLSKARRFEEAAEAKLLLEDEYARCMEKFEADFVAKFNNLMAQFDKRLESDLKNLRQKIEANRSELENTRKKDLDNLVLRYSAHKKAFDNKCKIEKAQKIMFLQAFDPSKNVNVSKFYAKYLENGARDVQAYGD